MTTFDTLAAARSIEGSGLPRQQAEAVAEQIAKAHAVDLSSLVTKDDLRAAVADLRREMADLRREMSEMLVRLLLAMVGIAGLALAVAKFL